MPPDDTSQPDDDCPEDADSGGLTASIPIIGDRFGPTEDSTASDGVFSYTGEWHAFQHGIGVGFAAVMPSRGLRNFIFEAVGVDADSRTEAMREVRAEAQYAIFGVFVGVAVGLVTYGLTLWLAAHAAGVL